MAGRRGRHWVLAWALAAAAGTGPVRAQEPEDPGQQVPPAQGDGIDRDAPQWDWDAARARAETRGRRHDGVMVRLTLGPGYFWSEQQAAGSSTRSSRRTGSLPFEGQGTGLSFAFDLGYGLNDELTLHARVLTTLAAAAPADPDVTGDDRGWVTAWVLGPALTYHLMPLNAYGTACGGVAFGEATVAGRQARSSAGYGLSLDVGKEWWIEREWGLGAALRWSFAHVPTELVTAENATPREGSLRTWSAALLLSATYQ